jgi:hypothetical protein
MRAIIRETEKDDEENIAHHKDQVDMRNLEFCKKYDGDFSLEKRLRSSNN